MSPSLNFDLQSELKNCKTLEDLLGKNGLIKKLTKDLLEKMLNEELSNHLGYQKHDSTKKNTENSRNGKSSKTVRSSFGEMELEIPRDRTGEFEPQVVKKHQRDISTFDEKIISMYAKGMTTRDIQSHVLDLYGVEISPTMISNITNKVMDAAREWQSRPLEEIYAVVYFDAIHYKVRQDGKIISKAAYTCLGLNMKGRKEILGIWIGESEGATFWLNIITELRNRGVEDILISCVDGLKGLPEAISNIYPKTQVQLCVVHLVRNSFKYVSSKNTKEFIRDLKEVYTAPTESAGYFKLEKLNDKWGKSYPLAVKPWFNHWTNICTFFQYPPELRRIIYTTNAVEALHRGFRKVSKHKGVYPTDDSLLKQLYLVSQDISKKWSMPVANWGSILTYLALNFEDRLKSYLNVY